MRYSAIAFALIVISHAARALDAGCAAADITPDVKAHRVPLAGYGARFGKPATGVHDPLHAKVLVLRGEAQSLALITCDLRSITPELKAQVVAKSAALGFNADNVFLCASHTHDGPAMYPQKFWQLQFGVYDPRIVEAMSDAIAKALKEAVANAAPAKIGFATENVEGFAHNRRWEYDNAARLANGETPVLSTRVAVMRVDAMDGSPRAVFVNFASHPTILGAKNMLISAEWPGVMQRELEKAFPGAIAMFSNGAEGDQAPSNAKGDDEFARVEDYGKRLAEKVAPIARAIKTEADVPVAIKRGTPALPEIAFSEGAKKQFASFGAAAKQDLPKNAEIQIVRIGNVAFVGLPGEPIQEVGQAVEQAVAEHGIAQAITVGLANDYIGYLVNEMEYAHGGYEVDSRSYYGPGLGAFLVHHVREVATGVKAMPK